MSQSSQDADRPLAGRRVLVTRSVGQSAALAERLRERGAEVVEIPMVRIAPAEDPSPFHHALRALGGDDWLLLTSANAVHALADAIRPAGRDLPATVRLASAGPATSDAIRARFPGRAITAQAIEAFGSEGLARAFSLIDVRGQHMLFPVSDRSPAGLAAALRARGANVEVVVAYRTLVPEGISERLQAALDAGLDAVTFASPSAVETFAHVKGAGFGVPVVVIGPSTDAAARTAGLTVAGMAGTATDEGLAAAVERCFAGTPGNR